MINNVDYILPAYMVRFHHIENFDRCGSVEIFFYTS